MHSLILYPTETVYGLGADPFDTASMNALYECKGREPEKAVTWLVRSISDIERYAVLSDTARALAEHFLPGPLTLVLSLNMPYTWGEQRYETIGFRISSDPFAAALIAEHMAAHNTPLTATSANRSGQPPEHTPETILSSLGDGSALITQVVDGGARAGVPSTVVSVHADNVKIIRAGAIHPEDIFNTLTDLSTN